LLHLGHEDMDARDKRGHDGVKSFPLHP
jgi:hypothetical protein